MKVPWWFPFGKVPEITPAELRARLEQGDRLQIVDVRTEAEFARGHLPGAINLPIQRFRREISTLDLDRERPVIVVCATAHRSRPAVRLLRQQGYEAFQLAGGMARWR
ncbi:MAG: rhodanese-like domain-containing protein [Chloroflexi bacterium]|nr:MAG: rhodanese-like domain-containing protein [Chloroflexota bacterium]